jgi:hypothetical protein
MPSLASIETVKAVWKLFQTLAGQRQTDQSPPEAGHEVDDFRGRLFGRDHEVAFVFPVFVVGDDDQAAGTDGFESLLHAPGPTAVFGHSFDPMVCGI